jgi:hypothetical protein
VSVGNYEGGNLMNPILNFLYAMTQCHQKNLESVVHLGTLALVTNKHVACTNHKHALTLLISMVNGHRI